LYELHNEDIKVMNPFNHDVQFKIELYPEKPSEAEIAQARKKLIKKKTQKPNNDPPEYKIPPFFCKAEKITIKRNGVYPL